MKYVRQHANWQTFSTVASLDIAHTMGNAPEIELNKYLL